jgi:hypothetical protein
MLYVDPGSGALLWQILAAGVVGVLFYVRKIVSFFHRSESRGDSDPEALDDSKIKLQ